jgi:ABC-type multidrug transport system fused ATPase/permease subunit
MILVLENGRIAERGTHQELIDHGGIYQRMIVLQTEDIGPSRQPESAHCG